MTAVPKRKLTPEEYLAIERKAEFKSEYFGGEMFAMAGASRQHCRITANLIGELHARLKGGPCQTFASDMRLRVPTTVLYTYPDIVIVCGEPQFEDEIFDTLLNPRVIIEVLSETTASYDRGSKYRHYQQIESLQEYVLIAQDEPAIEQLVRQQDGNWLSKVTAGLEREIVITAVPAKILVSEIYAGVTFPESPRRG